MSRHLEQSGVLVEVTIRDRITGELADPTTVTLVAEAPDGTQTDLDVNRASEGLYEAPLYLSEHGWWDVIVTTTGSYDISGAGKVYAIKLPFVAT